MVDNTGQESNLSRLLTGEYEMIVDRSGTTTVRPVYKQLAGGGFDFSRQDQYSVEPTERAEILRCSCIVKTHSGYYDHYGVRSLKPKRKKK
jgi:hypothetical protein